jgi:peptidoglycan/xylan/chitin deacetylase (PgdA/CDA1 family)
MLSAGAGAGRLKRALRLGFARSGSALRRGRGEACVRALTYHRFGATATDPWCVATGEFDAQMRWLAEQRRLVSLDDVRDFVAGRKALPADAVLVTIDDGCRSLHTHALPILREYRVPAVAFVSAGLVGARAVATDHCEPYATWDELARVREAGVEIGSHAYDHRSLGRMSDAEARDQALRSRAEIGARIGAPARSFAYPFGTRADFDARTDRVLAESGYEIAFHSVHGAIRPHMPAISLPRVKIEGGEGLRMVQLASDGAMDGWRLVDELRGRLVRRRSETRAGAAERSR